MDAIIWLLPASLLVFVSCICICACIHNARQNIQLENLEPTFPHPHPRPPLPPSRISSLTNLVELVIEHDVHEDPV